MRFIENIMIKMKLMTGFGVCGLWMCSADELKRGKLVDLNMVKSVCEKQQRTKSVNSGIAIQRGNIFWI